ncbi:metallophosphoesterase family protein [Aquimarina macrocephali]|uniref:metallophosphoesterase family protein n=1 Tax=Aquimarina macrocephali TaxID=666563 RepID=UPI000466E601|nr:metallophosphoesterase [Aquimarina macrocephali]
MYEKIAHITDLHLDEEYPLKNGVLARKRFDNIIKDIEDKKITRVVCTGDIGENKGISYFFEQLKTKALSITLGNHDMFSEISKHYSKGADYDSEKLYSSTIKEYYKFIYLDSSEGVMDKKQLLWLQKELISAKPIIIFVHHPIIGLNLKVDEIGKLKNREDIIPLLEDSLNEITIFCGHYHIESTLNHKNITQHITPAVSYQIEKNLNTIEINTSVFGYRIIEIDQNNISSKTQLLRDAD